MKRGRGGISFFVAGVTLLIAGVLAATAVGGASGERCKTRHCAGHTTTSTTRKKQDQRKQQRQRSSKPTSTTATTTTAAATTAAATSSGNGTTGKIVFAGGFGSPSYSPWTSPQCANYANPTNNNRVHFGTFGIDSQTVGQAPYSGRFTLPAWSGGRTRCELYTPRTANRGGDDYYSLMVYLPSGFSPGTSTGGVSIAQLNWEGMPGAPVSLHAYSDHVTVRLDSGKCGSNNTAVPCQYYSDADAKQTNVSPLYAVPRPMQLNVWHEIVLHVHWATDSTGVIDVWHRVKGQSGWTKTGSITGRPTLAVDSSGAFPNGTGDKIGAYRGASNASTTLLLDGFARATGFAAAAGNLP